MTGNATSTLTQFNGGLTAYASSTIGSGTQAGGLTISGGATTTGNAYFGGSVGIGTSTPTSLAELALEGTTFNNSSIAFFNSANSNAEMWQIGMRSNAGPLNTFVITNSTDGDVFNIRDGQVGIGDTTPSQLLDIDGTNPQLLTEESTTEFLRMGVGETAETSIIGWDDSDSLHLGVYSSPTDTTISELVTILSTGNVGVGTTSPATTLSVGGSLFVGASTAGGTLGGLGVGQVNTTAGTLMVGSGAVALVTKGDGDIVASDASGGLQLDASANDLYAQRSTTDTVGFDIIGRKSRGTAA